MKYDEYRFMWNYAELHGHSFDIPLNVDIELAKQCNLACVMCPYGDQEWQDSQPLGMMPTDMALRIVREIKAMGVPAMKANFRGEPLLHKDLERVLHEAQGMTDIRINTNLIGLTVARAYALKNLCNLIIVSMDGVTKESYEKIRVGATWERFIANLRILADARGDAEIQVQMVVQRDNEQDVEAFREMADDFGVQANLKPVMQRNGNVLQLGSQKATGRKLCGHPFQRIVIGFDGKAYGCCGNWNDEYIIGTYPDESIAELWDNERMNYLRQMARDPDGGYPCKDCTVGTSYSWA